MTRSSRAVALLSHRHRRGRVQLLLAASLALAAAHLQPFVGHALALMGAANSLPANQFTAITLGAPSHLTGAALGNDVSLNWSTGQNGTGYAISGATSSSDCSGATFAAVGTTAAITYTDAGRYSPPGTWFCYQVETSVHTWRSQMSNPRVAVQLGFVANAVNLINAGDTAGCNAGEFGAADAVDCGDQVVVGFNQAVDPSTGPDSADTVCAQDGSDTLWLGSTTTTGACTAAETVRLGTLTGGALGLCDCRYSASYSWAADSRTLTVTLGTRLAGANDASLSGAAWTLAPSTDSAVLLSATGGIHICDTNDGGGNCMPPTP